MPASTFVLSSRRTILLVSLDRHEKFLNDFLPERDAIEIDTRIAKLEQLSIDLEKIQSQLEDSATSNEEITHNAALRDNFEPRLIRAHSQLKANRVHIPRGANTSQNAGSNPLLGIKLPTISLPEYDGDYMQWLTYRDTFEGLIHDNTELPPIQKFHYLRASLKGEAAKVIESITISAANYDLAWKTLTERYSNEYLLKKRHLQALFGMATVRRESASTLHHLVDEFERHKQTLTHLGENTEAWSSLLEHLLCMKLPATTLRDWEEFASTNENPSYENLVTFLQRRMRVLETLMVNNHDAPSTGNSTQSATKQTNPAQLASFHSTSRDTRKCTICHQDHAITKCPRFMTMTPEERYQSILSRKLCLNCLRDNHRVRDCSSQYKCRHCNLAHHTLLHALYTSNGSFPTASTMPAARNAPTNTPHNTDDHLANTHMHYVAAHASKQSFQHVLLQTAVVNIVDAHGIQHPARALLDSASQPDLMSSRLAHRLNLQHDSVNIKLIGAGQSFIPVKKTVHAKITSRTSPYQMNADFLIVDKLIGALPAQDLHIDNWQIPPGFMLADPQFHKSAPIDLILGARHYPSFFQGSAQYKISSNLPVLIESVFGWVVTGAASTPHPQAEISNASSIVCMATLEESLEQSWKKEELHVRDCYSPEEQYCDTVYQQTPQREDTGRYIVQLPNQPDFEDKLGSSKSTSLRRFVMIQELWLQKAGWDDPVPESICKRWKDSQQDWQHISPFKIDRYARLPDSRIQLHTFCDASEAAYGDCTYVRCENDQGEVRITLISSKSRVAPLKCITHTHMHSDNGKNFGGASHELTEPFNRFEDKQQRNIITIDCANKGTTWHFTPPKAPPFGGLWEAAVKTAKQHLYRHIGSSRLSFEGYCTVLQQIEAAMNSRPLLPISDDPNDLAALTPAHFLIGTSMHAIPVPDYTGLKPCTLDELQRWQLLVQRFWKHWTREYLQEMQKDGMMHNKTTGILPGRLVILLDESLPTTRWPLARIVEVHPGQDQLTRVVRLKTAKGFVTRPLRKICILPSPTEHETSC